MVEASIVLPVLISTVLGMIMLLIFFYSCMITQVKLHESIIEDAALRKSTFEIVKRTESTSSIIGGLTDMFLKKDVSASYYVIDEANLIRLGKAISDDK